MLGSKFQAQELGPEEALRRRSCSTSLHSTASTLTSLSLASLASKKGTIQLQPPLYKEKKLDDNKSFENKKQQYTQHNSNKKLDSNSGSLQEKELVEQLAETNSLFSQLQRNSFETKKSNKQLQGRTSSRQRTSTTSSSTASSTRSTFQRHKAASKGTQLYILSLKTDDQQLLKEEA